jgi:hypothetical protein
MQRIQRERCHGRDRSLSSNRRRFKEDDDGMNVFSSYEILYQSLESSQEQHFQDAVELLHVFSYLHFQNIRLDILISANTNPLKEAKQREKDTRDEEELKKKLANTRHRTWSKWLREQVMRLAQYLDSPPPLPAALEDPYTLGECSFEGDVRDRLSKALAVLLSRSLVTSQDRVERQYSMHPLVHKWVRERPSMSASQQALWCEVTMTTLSRSILLPPHGDTESERIVRWELLPLIIHVRSCQWVIKGRLEERRAFRNSIWPAIVMDFGRHQAIEAVRFSRVYSECGLFSEAMQLQSKVRAFAIQALGEEHLLSIQVTLFLVSTLVELSEMSKATRLQRRLYDICVESMGQDDPLTLKVTDLLGTNLSFHGRWTESRPLHLRAIEGMKRVFGEDHENTLKAFKNLAKTHLRTLDYEKAAELDQLAWEGMKKRLGELHTEALFCLEDLQCLALGLENSIYLSVTI